MAPEEGDLAVVPALPAIAVVVVDAVVEEEEEATLAGAFSGATGKAFAFTAKVGAVVCLAQLMIASLSGKDAVAEPEEELVALAFCV